VRNVEARRFYEQDASAARSRDAEAAEAVAAHAAVADSLGGNGNAAPSPPSTQGTSMARARRIAVYDLKLEGVDHSMGAVVTESLLGELRKLQGISAIGMDEVRDMLAFEHSKDQMGCDPAAPLPRFWSNPRSRTRRSTCACARTTDAVSSTLPSSTTTTSELKPRRSR
jgi:hypothetical protein